MAHKLREAVSAETAESTVSGTVEVDGAYFSGHVRLENRKEERKDRRLAENQTGKRRVVVAMCDANNDCRLTTIGMAGST